MRAVDVIRSKRDGHALSPVAIDAFVMAAATGLWPDYQLAALLMAICIRGMDRAETIRLTDAMVRTGARLDLSDVTGVKVGKHSTGGVGDKTSLVLAPLAAACGAVVPKMSGRGLAHSGGTLDKLEAIPGYRTDLSVDEFIEVVRANGCGITGPTSAVAPADRKLYHLRDVTATVESIPLITASILSKKLAEGLDVLVLDVKCGDGAFMKTPEDAGALADSLVAVGSELGLAIEAVVTDMGVPLGRAVGNALEVAEAVATLRGEGPADFTALCVDLTARVVRLAGLAETPAVAEALVRSRIADGSGLARLRRMVELQGGDPHVIDDPSRLPHAHSVAILRAERAGFVRDLKAEAVGRAAMRLGAGRDRAEDRVEAAAGVVLLRKPGDRVGPADPLAELHTLLPDTIGPASELLRQAFVIGDESPAERPLVLRVVRSTSKGARDE
jgi:pyrimidine-nucleoside phosphorylase